jgi:hypothetical protein
METNAMATVTVLPVKHREQDVVEAKNSDFEVDFTLAGIWQGFGRAILTKKQSLSESDTDAIKGLEMASRQADDLKKREQIRKDFVKEFFMQDAVRAALAKFFLANADKPRDDQILAITVLTRFVKPGMSVNLRDLEAQVAEATAETITTNYLRYNLIPLMKDIGLIVQPKEGVNGWQWRDMEKKESIKELANRAMKQAALMASPVHKELVDEQAKRYALFMQEKALKQRLAMEKANQQLIAQAKQKAEENEQAMVAMGMKQTVSNTPAWIAGGVVALLAAAWLVGNGHPANPQPEMQAAAYEQAPAYTGGEAGAAPAPPSPEGILRQQYRIAGMDWDKLPAATRHNILKEFAEQQAAMATTQGAAQ